MAQTSRRRYKIGQHKPYDESFDYHKSRSVIFQPQNASYQMSWVASAIHRKEGVEKLLQMWRGDSEGFYVQMGQRFPSMLRETQDKLDAITERFEAHNQDLVNQGKSPLKEMLPDLKTEQLQLEGRYDLLMSEIAALEKKLSEFQEKETIVKSKDVLRNGPQGSGQLRGGILVEVDGQRVSKNEDGLLYIDEPSSQYHGMLTSDYFEMIVRPWQKLSGAYKGVSRNYHKQKIAAAGKGEKFTKEFPGKPAFPSIPKECKLVSLNQ
jgi:hypothetical protein